MTSIGHPTLARLAILVYRGMSRPPKKPHSSKMEYVPTQLDQYTKWISSSRWSINMTQTLHVCHICLHWGGLRGQLIGIYGIHGASGLLYDPKKTERCRTPTRSQGLLELTLQEPHLLQGLRRGGQGPQPGQALHRVRQHLETGARHGRRTNRMKQTQRLELLDCSKKANP